MNKLIFPARYFSLFVFMLAVVGWQSTDGADAQTSSGETRAPEIFIDKGGIFSKPWEHAVDGVDVVAYFTADPDAVPIEGSPAFKATYKGAIWLFSSAENLERFEADPAAYAPQYGGYCAWAVAEGKLAKGDPRYWRIHEGKLYLNVSKRIKKQWLSDVSDYIARADANWPGVLAR